MARVQGLQHCCLEQVLDSADISQLTRWLKRAVDSQSTGDFHRATNTVTITLEYRGFGFLASDGVARGGVSPGGTCSWRGRQIRQPDLNIRARGVEQTLYVVCPSFCIKSGDYAGKDPAIVKMALYDVRGEWCIILSMEDLVKFLLLRLSLLRLRFGFLLWLRLRPLPPRKEKLGMLKGRRFCVGNDLQRWV